MCLDAVYHNIHCFAREKDGARPGLLFARRKKTFESNVIKTLIGF
jgi:hypothetical protein